MKLLRSALAAVPLAACAALVAACVDLSNPGTGVGLLRVSPILDSTFVGDTMGPLTVTYLDATGTPRDPGPVRWSITVDSVAGAPDPVATIDSVTGRIAALRRGVAIALARARGLLAPALIVVSRRLDLTLLLDTVYVMPGDTITLPLAVVRRRPVTVPHTVWFSPSPDASRYTIDTASGFVSAIGPGGPLAYVAHAAAAGDTVADTGAVAVMTLADTSGGRFFMSVLGTAIRHQGGAAYAQNFRKPTGRDYGFRLVDSLYASGGAYERVVITLADSLTGTGDFLIDSLGPHEASAGLGRLGAACDPPRPWAEWRSILPRPGILALSHRLLGGLGDAGSLSVTQRRAIPHGFVISGRYQFTAQRTDLYSDPSGALAIRGTFVAPLVSDPDLCEG